ncbi:hypothetical protein [Halorussus litoreus]|uniref:hypothetical protein n=1 Tax=Halorussus litoreus TaxID=1710536 RepID=UPI000E245955|nr:hypothetical protein [Halorussus litoreus]
MTEKYEKYDDWMDSMEKTTTKLEKAVEQIEEEDLENLNINLNSKEAELAFSGIINTENSELLKKEVGKVSGMIALKDLASDIEETHQEIKEWSESRGMTPSTERYDFMIQLATIRFLSDEYVLFFSLLSAMVEEISIELLKKELIEEEYQDSNQTDRLLERRMNQEQREQLLLRTGVIENGLTSEMSRIRSLRNMVLHDLMNRMFLDEEMGYNDVERGLNTAEKLSDKL